jgi:ferredoxin
MRISIDRAACQGNQLCLGIAPALFDVDEDGLALVRDELVTPDLERDAEQAALCCPTQAVKISR